MNSISPPVWVPWGFWKIEGWFGLVKREFKNTVSPSQIPHEMLAGEPFGNPSFLQEGLWGGREIAFVPWLLTHLLCPPGVDWKDWCWSWNSSTLATWFEELTHLKRPWCCERLKVEKKGTTEDEMVGWHHWLNGHEFEQALGVGDGREAWHAAVHGVAKSQTWLSDSTELNWSNYNIPTLLVISFSHWIAFISLLKLNWSHLVDVFLYSILFHWSICLYWCQHHTSQFL